MSSTETGPFRAFRTALSSVEQRLRRLGNDVISRYPVLRAPILQLWLSYTALYGRAQSLRYRFGGRNRTTVDPFRVVEVDPTRIEYLVESDGYPHQARQRTTFPAPKFKHAGRVVGGEWDERTHRFEDTDLYRGFEARFERDTPWRETVFYQTSLEHIENGVELWGCTSESEFERRLEFVETLYDTVDERGYLSQAELSADPDTALDGGSDGVLNAVGEIAVCVGRDGEILFADGRNRLAIAKLLDLDSIPVWIMVRHAKWQRRRDCLAADPERWELLPERLRDHPDLADVRPQ